MRYYTTQSLLDIRATKKRVHTHSFGISYIKLYLLQPSWCALYANSNE